MREGVFYPNYTPDETWLRCALLFFDTIHTIVPKIDQGTVRNRAHVDRLLQVDPDIIKFDDPDEDVKRAAFGPPDVQALKRLIYKINLDFHRSGHYEADDGYCSWIAGSDLGRYLARQKLPQDIFKMLRRAGLATEISLMDPITGLTRDPLLVHPIVADFVMARLADTVAALNSLASLTDRLNEFAVNSTRNIVSTPHGGRSKLSERAEVDLLTTTMRFVVPRHIERLSVRDYFNIRSQYEDEGLREATQSLFQEIAQQQNKRIENLSNLEAYGAFLHEQASSIERRVKRIHARILEEREDASQRFALVSVVSVISATIGAGLGGPLGALLGAAGPVAFEAVTRGRWRQSGRGVGNDTYRALATLRSDIIGASLREVIYPGPAPA